MKVSYCAPDIDWACRVTLNSKEWPPLDTDGEWLSRPIRKWVYDHCYNSGMFFAADGWILFKNKEDAVLFQLTWSE